jgi:hypothetical protein
MTRMTENRQHKRHTQKLYNKGREKTDENSIMITNLEGE